LKNILFVTPLAYEAPLAIKRLKRNYGSEISVTALTVGVGPKKSAKGLSEFLSQKPDWDLILCAGLAGALSRDLSPGDWVIPESITQEEGETIGYEPVALAEVKQVPFLTSHQILKPSEKRERLLKQPNLKAVDMESFSMAAALENQDSPYVILRTILDGADFVFPDFKWIFQKKTFPNHVKFCFFFVTHPGHALRVLRYEWQLHSALSRLALLVDDWVGRYVVGQKAASRIVLRIT